MLLAVSVILSGLSASAYVRSSVNYRIESDSVNSGGTDESVSNSYKAWDTVGEVGTGDSSSDKYGLSAGYRQVEENYLALTVSTSSIKLLPSLSGLIGGVASGTGSWTVKTDAIAGYSLRIKATSSPALKSGFNSIEDYTPETTGIPDFFWNIGTANSEFGFSPYNPYSQPNKYKNNTSACSEGTEITDERCWYHFLTSDETIAYKTARTGTGGEDTKVSFRAEINSSTGIQEAGEYTAAIVITAVAN